MTTLITYTDEKMTRSAKLCVESALKNNIHKAVIYQPHDLDHSLLNTAGEKALRAERGSGYWIWKPMILKQHIATLQDGDILIYCDAGIEIINNINYIVDDMKWIRLFTNGHKHVHWCKGDVLNYSSHIPDLDTFEQVQASVIMFRVGGYARHFINDWLALCCTEGAIDDSESKMPNHPEFREHRHDQSCLMAVALSWKVGLNWWPAMYGSAVFPKGIHYKENYPPVFSHHYRRNPGKGKGRPEW